MSLQYVYITDRKRYRKSKESVFQYKTTYTSGRALNITLIFDSIAFTIQV